MLLPRFLLAMACLGVVAMAHAADPPYDPLAVESSAVLPAPLDLDVVDEGRERTIPVRVWLPSHARPAPVITTTATSGSSAAADSASAVAS